MNADTKQRLVHGVVFTLAMVFGLYAAYYLGGIGTNDSRSVEQLDAVEEEQQRSIERAERIEIRIERSEELNRAADGYAREAEARIDRSEGGIDGAIRKLEENERIFEELSGRGEGDRNAP